MTKTWFTSDNHYGHKNIHKFCPDTRPDHDVNIMNNNMIHRWNEQVAPMDYVWALGDFFFCNADEALRILPRLNGIINLIYGNHDKTIRNSERVQSYFESIQEYKELNVRGHKFCLFHYPIEEWNNMHHGAIHCYGHIHQKKAKSGGRMVNVCIDSPDLQTPTPYSLFSDEEVIHWATKQEIRGHHDRVIL